MNRKHCDICGQLALECALDVGACLNANALAASGKPVEAFPAEVKFPTVMVKATFALVNGPAGSTGPDLCNVCRNSLLCTLQQEASQTPPVC